MTATTLTIYQDFLDHMGEALVACDVAHFTRHIFLPHVIRTETKVIEFQTVEAMAEHFHGFAGALAAQEVDAYVRVARQAAFDGDTRITGQHDSFMTSRGKLVVPKFSSQMELELRDGVWGARVSHHLATYVAWPHILPRAPEVPDDS